MTTKNETSILIEEKDKEKLFILYNEFFLHSIRVAAMAGAIAKELNYGEANVNKLFWAGMWHDIGKFLVMDIIFLNDLSEEQIGALNKHPEFSFDILVKSKGYIAPEILGLVLFHHRHPDGTGYPRMEGLVSEKLQILSAADNLDAITHERHYRNGKINSKKDAVIYLRGCKYEEKILSAIEKIDLEEKNLSDFFPPTNVKIAYTEKNGLKVEIERKIFEESLRGER